LQELAPQVNLGVVQKPTDFVREQVSTVRETVATAAASAAAEATTVSGTVTSHVGDFIRSQRNAAQVSLRELSRAAGVSNPYLSQVERGLRKPSAEILASIARGLKISAETLYEQAGILDRRSGTAGTVAAIRSDEALSERHKAVLLELYETYAREHARDLTTQADGATARPAAAPTVPSTPSEETPSQEEQA
jgi:transcriptional regulator with XRE-family HTH domain